MTYHAKVIAGGKIVIPADLRRELGINDGDTVVIERTDDGALSLRREEADEALLRLREALPRLFGRPVPSRTSRGLGRVRQVIDASVLLAYILGEPGGEYLSAEGPFCLSSGNYAEVLSKLEDRGGSRNDVDRVVTRCAILVYDVTRADAVLVGRLRPLTRAHGLSLGDRICLALAERLQVPVATAERAWAALDLGLDVRLIR